MGCKDFIRSSDRIWAFDSDSWKSDIMRSVSAVVPATHDRSICKLPHRTWRQRQTVFVGRFRMRTAGLSSNVSTSRSALLPYYTLFSRRCPTSSKLARNPGRFFVCLQGTLQPCALSELCGFLTPLFSFCMILCQELSS